MYSIRKLRINVHVQGILQQHMPLCIYMYYTYFGGEKFCKFDILIAIRQAITCTCTLHVYAQWLRATNSPRTCQSLKFSPSKINSFFDVKVHVIL